MSDLEQRLRDAEALNLLTNRVLMDFLSLQVDSGQASLDGVKRLIRFSADQVVHGSNALGPEVRFLQKVLIDRFDDTYADQKETP